MGLPLRLTQNGERVTVGGGADGFPLLLALLDQLLGRRPGVAPQRLGVGVGDTPHLLHLDLRLGAPPRRLPRGPAGQPFGGLAGRLEDLSHVAGHRLELGTLIAVAQLAHPLRQIVPLPP